MLNDLTAFERDLLFVINGLDEPYGLSIKRDLEDHYGEDINHGRLYPNLDDLVQRGFVEKGEIDRRTNSYELTDEGREAIQEHRDWQAQFL